jgi:hypothetical protein
MAAFAAFSSGLKAWFSLPVSSSMLMPPRT